MTKPLFFTVGRCSYFGGPGDTTGVDADEALAFIYEIEEKPELFLPYQPEGTTGLARRLNPCTLYVACRWDYNVTSREMLRAKLALVCAVRTRTCLLAMPSDWGPHQDTGRVADLSPSLMQNLGINTDDEVAVIFPWEPK